MHAAMTSMASSISTSRASEGASLGATSSAAGSSSPPPQAARLTARTQLAATAINFRVPRMSTLRRALGDSITKA